MSRDASPRGQLAIVVVVGLTVLALPAGFALALPAPATSTGITPTPPPILNQTDTPTETTTTTSTSTPTSTGTPGDTQTDAPGSEGTDAGQTIVVDNDLADCPKADFKTIQAAVDAASAGDRVEVCAGSYPERVDVPVGTSNLTLVATGTASIEGVGQPAIRSNASGVTIEGFDISANQGATYAVVVGGQDTVVRDNTVEASNGTGIFLSDGFTHNGEPDPELGAAIGSRIVNNTVTAHDFRIWADADQAVIRHNTVSDLTEVAPERRQCTSNACEGANHSIVSSGNDTVIRQNTVEYDNHPPSLNTPLGSGIMVGLDTMPGKSNYSAPKRGAWHDEANDNLVVNNTVSNAPGNDGGIGLLQGAKGTDVRNNTLVGNFRGMRIFSNGTLVRNNNITRLGYGIPHDGMIIYGSAKIINNSIALYGTGIEIRGHAEVIGNTIRDNVRSGVVFGHGYFDQNPLSARVVDNTIIDNGEDGIRLADKLGPQTSPIQIHRNRILNNSGLGINNQNSTRIVNARNNIWACGGPSSGTNPNPLADPYTGRLANGSGDAISAGNKSGVSNVHFDPFKVLSSCESQPSTSTPTATPTPTPTPTPSPTPPPAGGVPGTASGGGDGPGTGDASGDGPGSGDGDGADSDGPSGSDGDGGDTATASSTSSATASRTPTATPPPTPTPTVTLSPTPAVEPGFGVLTWLGGVVLLLGLLVGRRRMEA